DRTDTERDRHVRTSRAGNGYLLPIGIIAGFCKFQRVLNREERCVCLPFRTRCILRARTDKSRARNGEPQAQVFAHRAFSSEGGSRPCNPSLRQAQLSSAEARGVLGKIC